MEEIEAIKNNVAILKENQDILSSQIQKTFNFINLTYTETDTNRLLFNLLQKGHSADKQYCPPPMKRDKITFYERNFVVIIFQLRCHLAPPTME